MNHGHSSQRSHIAQHSLLDGVNNGILTSASLWVLDSDDLKNEQPPSPEVEGQTKLVSTSTEQTSTVGPRPPRPFQTAFHSPHCPPSWALFIIDLLYLEA